MSKPTVRVIVSVLIGLAIVLAVFASVQAASPGVARGQPSLTAGLLPDVRHVRSAGQSLTSSYEGSYQEEGGGHGCERDNQESPDD